MKSIKNLKRGAAILLCAAMLLGDSTMLYATELSESAVAGNVIVEATADELDAEQEVAPEVEAVEPETAPEAEAIEAGAEVVAEVAAESEPVVEEAAPEAEAVAAEAEPEADAVVAETEPEADADAEEVAEDENATEEASDAEVAEGEDAEAAENDDAEVEAEEEKEEEEKVELPTSFEASVDDATVTVIVEEGTFSEPVTLQVSKIEITDEIQAKLDEQAIAEKKSIESVTAYDISFINEAGAEVEPAKQVQVSIATSEVNTGDDASVYHVDEATSSLEDMNASTVENGDVVFDTTHFSMYVIVNGKQGPVQVKIHHLAQASDGSYYDIFRMDDKLMEIGGQINNYNKADEDSWHIDGIYKTRNGNYLSDSLSDAEKESLTVVSDTELFVIYGSESNPDFKGDVTFWDYQANPKGTETKKYTTYRYKVDLRHASYHPQKDKGIEENKYFFSKEQYSKGEIIYLNHNYEYQGRDGKLYLEVKSVETWEETDRDTLQNRVNKRSKKIDTKYLSSPKYYNDVINEIVTGNTGPVESVNILDNYSKQPGYDANRAYLTVGKTDNSGQNDDNNKHNGMYNGSDINQFAGEGHGSDRLKKNIVDRLEGENYANVIFNVNDPGVFTKDESVGKQLYEDYQLVFNKTGDTYELQKVVDGNGDWAANAGKLFFPMDGVVNDLGDDRGNDKDKIENSGVMHNDFFGMRYDVTFQIGDYYGPLDYTFKGDDDLWVFIDGTLVSDLDLGGIHQWVEGKADLWKYIDGDKDNCDRTATHTLTVLYMERGGVDSNCNMKFTIPHAGFINYSTPKGDFIFQKTDEDGNALSGAVFELTGQNGLVREATSNDNGVVSFNGLYVGKYVLSEKDAPKGYEKSNDTWKVKVVANSDNETATATVYDADETPVSDFSVKNLKEEVPVTPTFNKDKRVSTDDEQYKKREYVITLTAQSTTAKPINKKSAVDIMLLLDTSGSMAWASEYKYEYVADDTYTDGDELSNYTDYYVKVEDNYYPLTKEYSEEHWGWYYFVPYPYYTYSYAYNLGNEERLLKNNDLLYILKKEAGQSRVDALKESVKVFLDTVSKESPESKIGIVGFSSSKSSNPMTKMYDLQPITSDPKDAKDSLDKIVAVGGTSPDIAMEEAVSQFNAAGDNNKKIVILFTDGEPTGNIKFNEGDTESQANIANWESKGATESWRKTLDTNGVTIYTVGFALRDNAKDWLENTIATKPDYALTADTQERLTEIFGQLSTQIMQSQDIAGATITDVLDPRFELTKEGRKALIDDGATISEDGMTITWTGQTIPYDYAWTKTIAIKAKDAFLGGNLIPTNAAGSGITVNNEYIEFPHPTVNVKLLDLEGTPWSETVFLGENIYSDSFTQDLIDHISGLNLKNLTFDEHDKCEVTYEYAGDAFGTIKLERKKEGEGSSWSSKDHVAKYIGSPAERYTLEVSYEPYSVEKRGEMNPKLKEMALPEGAEVTEAANATAVHTVNVIAGTIRVTKQINKKKDFKESYGDPVFTFKIANGTDTYYKTVRFNREVIDKAEKDIVTLSADIVGLPAGKYTIEELPTMGFEFVELTLGLDGADPTKVDGTVASFTFGSKANKANKDANATFTNTMKHSKHDTDTDVVKNHFSIKNGTNGEKEKEITKYPTADNDESQDVGTYTSLTNN
ncbi:MAG: VWA domain-containing protein [Lachnospiraceae bacterium]|nr:VWA domain-containing protein [Lachnospiraceae bacterium]